MYSAFSLKLTNKVSFILMNLVGMVYKTGVFMKEKLRNMTHKILASKDILISHVLIGIFDFIRKTERCFRKGTTQFFLNAIVLANDKNM